MGSPRSREVARKPILFAFPSRLRDFAVIRSQMSQGSNSLGRRPRRGQVLVFLFQFVNRLLHSIGFVDQLLLLRPKGLHDAIMRLGRLTHGFPVFGHFVLPGLAWAAAVLSAA